MTDDVRETPGTTDVGRDIDDTIDKIEANVNEDIKELEWTPDDAAQPETLEKTTESSVGLHTLDVPPGDPPSGLGVNVLDSRGFKVMTASAATLGVMGVAGLVHPQKAGEIAAPVEPTPIVQEVDSTESTSSPVEIDQEQDAGEEAAESQGQTNTEARDQDTPAKVESHIETAPIEEPWWMDVPSKSQQGLTYSGGTTQYGCAPTATSMVLDYWHAQDSANQTMSAQDLLNVNADQGEFRSRGMSVTNIHDEVQRLGYGVVEDHIDSDLDTLKKEVADGPVIASVKLNMKPSGNNHSVVVTGISQDNQVRVNDPWTGEAHTYSWEVFSQSWGADFGSGTRNHFTVIRPS